jgi:hypothetical protein
MPVASTRGAAVGRGISTAFGGAGLSGCGVACFSLAILASLDSLAGLLFGTLIVTYVYYLGKDVVDPTPAEALKLPLVLFTTVCLLSNVLMSIIIHFSRIRFIPSGSGRFASGVRPHATQPSVIPGRPP